MFAGFAAPGPAAPHGSETVVLIKSGAGMRGIAQALADARRRLEAWLFQIGVRLHGETAALKAGEYAIPSHASMFDIMNILIAGKSIEHKLTVAEGLTSQMAYDIVKDDPVLIGDAGPVPPEGTLLPETYLFTRGATRGEIIAKMQKAQQRAAGRIMGQARAGPADQDQGGGRDPGLHRGEGNRHSRRAPRISPRCSSTGCGWV